MPYALLIRRQARKKLQSLPSKVAGWRVIFDGQDAVRVIAIEKIKPLGDACK